MELFLLFIRVFLFGVFALAAIGKLLDLEGSEKAVKEFGTPEEFANAFAIALPFAELVFAVCFLFPEASWVGGIGALILLLSFIGGMIWQISQGRAPDCHCFGQIHSEPVGKKSLIRNIAFAVLALFLVAQGRENQGLSFGEINFEMTQTIFVFLSVAVLAVIAFLLKKILDQQSEIIKRIDILDAISRDGATVERHTAGDPHDGLPIGSPFPDFVLHNAAGKQVEFGHLLMRQKPMLFFFVSPDCQPCKALLPEVKAWRTEFQDKMAVILFSGGTASENLEEFGAEFSDDVLLQVNREVAESVKAKWTPTALFVRSDGTIGGHLAAGDTAIRELVENLREADLDSELVYFANERSTPAPRKIGEKVPEFALADLGGNEVKSDDFFGKETLALFWNPGCPHCRNMETELRDWDNGKVENEPNLVVFSEGSTEAHLEMGLKSPVLLQKDYEVAVKMGMYGTPSAVFVNEKGEIVSETAAGANNIWALIGKRKS